MVSEAPACRAALNQANVRWPGRGKRSDGILSSEAHKKQNPTSDHDHGNAFDLTHSPFDGPNCADEATRLVGLAKSGQAPWLKYVIFNGRIATAKKGWDWRPYVGANDHAKHMHVSIFSAYRNAEIAWWDRPIAAPEEDDMTPEQAKQLKEVHQILTALVRPRRADKKDHDKGQLDLGDLLTAIEEDQK